MTVWAEVDGMRCFRVVRRVELSDMGGLMRRSGVRLTMEENSAERRRSDFCSSAERS